MKNFFLLFCCFLGKSLWAEYIPEYTLLKDTLKTSISENYAVIKGKVIDYNGKPVSEGLISTTDFSHQTKTDALGNFELTLPQHFSDLFFYKMKYGEVIISYDFKSQHEYTYEITATENHDIIEVEKPVIYLYGDTDFKLSLSPLAPFVFTYPNYDQSWNFTATPSGNIVDKKNQKSYPYLFWESKTTQLQYSQKEDVVEGFMVETDTVVQFLENQLTFFGFNTTEKTDFITYWAPRMIEKQYVFIQFLVGETYAERIASYELSPKAASELRVFMLFTPLDNTITQMPVVPQQLTSTERKGFTIVEWGGAELPMFIRTNW